MSLELRADVITGSQGNFHEIFVDGASVVELAAMSAGVTINTANFVTTSETGNFVSTWETGSFASSAGATNLSDLSDVDTTAADHTPDNGEVLTWNDSHGHWMPMPAAGGITWSSAPASKTAAGSQGDMAFDSNYFYICVLNNEWRRTPLSTW